MTDQCAVKSLEAMRQAHISGQTALGLLCASMDALVCGLSLKGIREDSVQVAKIRAKEVAHWLKRYREELEEIDP